jgi:hypothetical protein
MRRLLAPAALLAATLAASSLGASPAAAWPDVSNPVASPVAGQDSYILRADSLPDSLRAEIPLAPGDSTRRWNGPELETAALRLRDALARRGDAAATVRLHLARGKGSAPGSALLTIRREAPDSGVPGSMSVSAVPLRYDPVLSVSAPLSAPLADSVAGAYRAASRGDASVDAIAAGLSAARDVLIEAGFYGAEVGLDSLAPAARAYLRVIPGPPAVFESLELPGATATRPAAAAAIAGLRAGARLTPAVLAETRDRLTGSGLFTVVGDPRLAAGSIPGGGGARIVIPVEEERSSRFEGALGIAREGGVTGLIDLALGNIAGSGRAAGLRWFGPGGGRSEYAARYREPALFGRRADATLALDAQVADSLFTQTRWSLAVGVSPASGVRASLGVIRSGSVYSGLARGSSATWSVAGRATLDRLRPLQNPTGGFRVAAGAEGGRRTERYPGMANEAGRSLFRGDLALEGAAHLGPRRALYAAVRGAGALLSGEEYPAEELFFVGGSEGLRGHRDRAFAGSRIAATSIEHRWITDDRGGRLYLFADAARHDLAAPLAAGTAALPPSLASGGAAVSLARTVLSPGWEFGYGAGLRTRMASGLVGLELGFAPGEPLRRATIHVRYASTW